MEERTGLQETGAWQHCTRLSGSGMPGVGYRVHIDARLAYRYKVLT